MSGILYESLAREDIRQIRPLWDRLRLLTRSMTTHFKQRYEELDFDQRFAKLGRAGTRLRIDVARDGESGPVVGYAVGSVTAEGGGEIDSFYVDERYRRQGIGTRLLERILGWMAEQGAQDVMVLTAYENHDVLALYERFGFYPRLVMLSRK